MKKRIAAMAMTCLFVLSIGLAACGRETEKLNAQAESDSSTNQADPKPITMTFWRPGTDENGTNYWSRVIADYQKENPNVRIEMESIPWGNEIETKLNAAFASGTSPDVMAYSIASIAQRAGLGQYADLDEYINQWDGKEDMIPNALELGTYLGKTYGLTIQTDPRVFAWRKDWFEEAGLDPSRAPKDWNELAEYAVKLTKREGDTVVRAGMEITTSNSWTFFQGFILQNGGKLMDIENNQPLFDQPEAVEALAYLTDLVLDKKVTIPSDGLKSGEGPFQTGKAAMAYTSPGALDTMYKEDPSLKEKIGISAPIPGKKSAAFCGAQLMFVSSESNKKDAAWDYVKFVLSKEETWKRFEEGGHAPVRMSLRQDFIDRNPERNTAILDTIAVGQGAVKVTYSTKVGDYMSMAAERAYYGEGTPEAALKEEAEKLRKEIPSLIKN